MVIFSFLFEFLFCILNATMIILATQTCLVFLEEIYIPGNLFVCLLYILHSSVGKESAGNAADTGLIPGLKRSPGEGNGNPLQYACLENAMDRGAWRTTVHSIAKSQT